MAGVHDKALKRDFGKTGLIFTGVGSIIGSGWLFGAFDAASTAGPAAILSWALGAALVLTVPGIFVSIAMVAVFCIINMFGVKFFAQFNNVLVWWKLLVIVLVFVGLALLAFNPGHFHMPEFGGFAPNGIAPIFAALPAAGIVFSYLGFRQGVEFAGETKNP